MATTCAKPGTSEETSELLEKAAEYVDKMDKQSTETIKSCLDGDITSNQAKSALVRQWVGNPKGFCNTVQQLENSLNTGRTIINTDVRMIPEGRVVALIYADGVVEGFQCNRNGEIIPVKPNPNFSPKVVGTKLRFAGLDQTYRSAQDVVREKINGVEKNTFTPSGGNCPQDPKLVPDFIPDPTRI
jgi:hypothetical protein